MKFRRRMTSTAVAGLVAAGGLLAPAAPAQADVPFGTYVVKAGAEYDAGYVLACSAMGYKARNIDLTLTCADAKEYRNGYDANVTVSSETVSVGVGFNVQRAVTVTATCAVTIKDPSSEGTWALYGSKSRKAQDFFVFQRYLGGGVNNDVYLGKGTAYRIENGAAPYCVPAMVHY